jgi:Ca2+/Na+ antiporter
LHLLHLIPISFLIYEIIRYNKEKQETTKYIINKHVISLYSTIIILGISLIFLLFIIKSHKKINTVDSSKYSTINLLIFYLIQICLYVPCVMIRWKRQKISF